MLNSGITEDKIVFLGLELEYSNQVLTPRLETESLVIGITHRVPYADLIIDIGTGSGSIILSMRTRFPQAILHAVDISPSALEIAKKNAKKHTIAVEFRLGNLLDRYITPSEVISSHKQVLLVANLPYIGTHEIIGKDVLQDDPTIALYGGGEDGFNTIRTLLEQSLIFSKYCHHLRVALEFGHLQLPLVMDWCTQHNLVMESWTDYSHIPRFALIDYGHR